MRLTAFTDYGLRMLMRMASAPGRAFSTADLADEFGLSRNHLAKIMQHLVRAGLVETRRGGGGGGVLARRAADIRLGTVVRLLEDGQPLVECLGSGAGSCIIDGRCRLKARLRSAEAAFLADLDRSTLADIVLDPMAFDAAVTADPQRRPITGRTAHDDPAPYPQDGDPAGWP
jgi:Rrf2 family nitric oxide-sensitive transcriptional repressor